MIKELDFNSEWYNSRAMEFKVSDDETDNLIQEMTDTLNNLEDRVYLCANEIGRSERAFAIKFEDGIKFFFNPVVQSRKEPKLVREIENGVEYIIPRSSELSICYQDSTGKVVANKFVEPVSLIVGRALDCIDGLHVIDYGLEIIPEFDSASEDEKAEVIKAYIDSLGEYKDHLDEELQNDESTKNEWTSYKYAKAKAEGTINFLEETPKPNRKQRRTLKKLLKKLSGGK